MPPIRLRATSGALSGIVNTNIQNSAPPSGDGTPILPQRTPRFSQLPPSRVGVPGGQVIRLTTGATYADLTAALTSAATLAVSGTAFVLLPNGADIQAPTGTTPYAGLRPGVVPNFPIVLAQAEWFDGATVYSTGSTLTRAQAVLQPVLRSIPITSSPGYEAEPAIRWTSTLDLVTIGIRLHDAADGLGFTRSVIELGERNNVSLTGDGVGHFAAWWCSGGLQQNGSQLPYTAAGAWRFGMGWVFIANGSGFSLRNYYHFGHGGLGEQGANRGVWAGWQSTGPWFIKGCNFQNPGGIPFMHGGATTFVGRECVDVTIEQCRFERTHTWNAEHPTLSAVDTNGIRCPYAGKNIGEWKAVQQCVIQDCLFLNDFTRGQSEAMVYKSATQETTTHADGTRDFTFRRNIVTAWNKGIFGLSISEGDTPGGTLGALRWAIYDNIFAMEQNRTALGDSGDGRNRLFIVQREVKFGVPSSPRPRQPRDISITNNLFWCFYTNTSDAVGPIFDGFRTSNPMQGLGWGRNIVGGAPRATGGTNPVEYAYTFTGDTGTEFGMRGFTNDAYFPPPRTIQQTAHIGVDTAFVTPLGSTPAPVAYANAAAAGLTVTAIDQYSYAGGAALLTADAGNRIGPDLATLMTMRTNVLAGTVI